MKIKDKQFNTITVIVATMLIIELIKLATFLNPGV